MDTRLTPYVLLQMSGARLKSIATDEDGDPEERLLAQEEIDRRKEKRARLRESLDMAITKGYSSERKGES